MADGLHIYDNPVGVLTNNPPFPQQLFQLNNYMGLSPRQPENRFAPQLPLVPYSRGMGALGLPGDLSSAVALCAGGLHADERRLRRFGNRKRQPVFPYFRIGRTAARLL